MVELDEDMILIYKCRRCGYRVSRQDAYKKVGYTCICIDCCNKEL